MFYALGLPSVLVYRLLPSSALGEPTRCLLWICAFVTIDPHPREVTCAINRIGHVQFTPTNPMVASQNGGRTDSEGSPPQAASNWDLQEGLK